MNAAQPTNFPIAEKRLNPRGLTMAEMAREEMDRIGGTPGKLPNSYCTLTEAAEARRRKSFKKYLKAMRGRRLNSRQIADIVGVPNETARSRLLQMRQAGLVDCHRQGRGEGAGGTISIWFVVEGEEKP